VQSQVNYREIKWPNHPSENNKNWKSCELKRSETEDRIGRKFCDLSGKVIITSSLSVHVPKFLRSLVRIISHVRPPNTIYISSQFALCQTDAKIHSFQKCLGEKWRLSYAEYSSHKIERQFRTSEKSINQRLGNWTDETRALRENLLAVNFGLPIQETVGRCEYLHLLDHVGWQMDELFGVEMKSLCN